MTQRRRCMGGSRSGPSEFRVSGVRHGVGHVRPRRAELAAPRHLPVRDPPPWARAARRMRQARREDRDGALSRAPFALHGALRATGDRVAQGGDAAGRGAPFRAHVGRSQWHRRTRGPPRTRPPAHRGGALSRHRRAFLSQALSVRHDGRRSRAPDRVASRRRSDCRHLGWLLRGLVDRRAAGHRGGRDGHVGPARCWTTCRTGTSRSSSTGST